MFLNVVNLLLISWNISAHFYTHFWINLGWQSIKTANFWQNPPKNHKIKKNPKWGILIWSIMGNYKKKIVSSYVQTLWKWTKPKSKETCCVRIASPSYWMLQIAQTVTTCSNWDNFRKSCLDLLKDSCNLEYSSYCRTLVQLYSIDCSTHHIDTVNPNQRGLLRGTSVRGG